MRQRARPDLWGAWEATPRSTLRAPGMARSALTGAVNRRAKANREVTWGCKSPGGLDDRNS